MTRIFDPDAEHFSLLIRAMALLCVRNTKLEDIHAGKGPITRTGDYTDVTVTDADGRQIPWNEISRISDDEMGDLMREIVTRLYTFHHHVRDPEFLNRIEIYLRSASQWDEPHIDPDFLGPTSTQTRH